MNSSEIMSLAIKQAAKTMREGKGGPFGAAIIKNNEIISVASNSVLGDHDPTAHAEINAIREACKKLNTHDLTDCELYTTAYPCPMCLSAIIWSNIKKIHYGCRATDADKIGFRDDFIYKFIENKCNNIEIMQITEVERENCLKLFEEYAKDKRTLY